VGAEHVLVHEAEQVLVDVGDEPEEFLFVLLQLELFAAQA